MAINTNVGPERVEVTPKPIGPILVPGASTAITCLVIATSKSSAPINTPITITSLSQFTTLFGAEAEVGEAYYSVQGFYQNAGEGAEMIIIAVNPSAVSGEILEVAQNQDARAVVGSVGSLLDSAVMVSDIELLTYNAITGACELDVSGADPDSLSKVRSGDFLRDEQGRLRQIVRVAANDTIFIEAALDQDLAVASNGMSENGATVAIVRIYPAESYNSKTIVQEGELYGAAVSVTVSGQILTTTAFDSFLNQINSGDIITDSANEEFIITDIIDGNNIQVDRAGMTAGAVNIRRGVKTKIVQTTTGAGATFLAASVAPYEAEAGKVSFNLADSSDNPAENALAGMFLRFSDGSEYKIASNKIKAHSDIIVGPLAGVISYNSATGIVTFPIGTTLIDDGVVVGDVLVDVNGKEYPINEVPSETTARIAKNIASPSPLAGAKVHKGAAEVTLANSIDLSFKVEGELEEDDSATIRHIANKIVVASGVELASDDYFICEPAVQSSDFIGSSADGSGIRALDAIDNVNLLAIPGIYDPAVQGAIIDYCTIERKDCFGLISIPEFVEAASIDKLLVSNLSIDTVAMGPTGSKIQLLGSPDLSAVSAYDIITIGSKRFSIKAVSDEDKQIFLFATAGVPSVGATSIAKPSAVTWKDVVVNKPSIKVAWYFNHLLVADSSGNTVVVDPVGHVAGVMARIDANISQGGVSHAPAGINLAQLAGITGLQLQISERVEAGPLRLAFINRITQSTGNGRYVFGAYTAGGNNVTADEQLIQVLRSLMFVKTSLERGLVGFLWENNSPVNRQNIGNAILNFFRANSYLFPAGLPENQQFQVELVEPTDLDLARGIVSVIARVRFNTAIRFVDIELQFPIPTEA
jgi:hypothetical protein